SDVVDMEKNYYIVAMFIGVMILLWILGKLFGKNSSKSFFIRSGNEKIPVKMEVQKVIDNNNKIVLLTIANMNYLVLVGSNNNTLLDKFKTGKKNLKTRGFDSKIRKNTNKIDSLIK
ncbi:MAG: hypothetical protein OIF32_02920, partial [Campylobacterales bacterium]|nr:hypothetical protein [Campylobacterales bacterium]